MRGEAERPVAHRVPVPCGLPQVAQRNRVQQMARHNGEVGQHVGDAGLGSAEFQLQGGVVGRYDRQQLGEIGATWVAGVGSPGRVQGPGSVLRDGRPAVVPAQPVKQREGEHGALRRPAPPPREIRHRAKQAVIAHQRHQQGVALHLPGERVAGKQRVDALQIRAGRDDHHVPTPGGRGGTGDGQQQREAGDRATHAQV